jgi:hypothetical protein
VFLVTGATGTIGRPLVNLLAEQGAQVRVVVQRVLCRVVGLVGAPDVDADGATVRTQLGRGKKHRAASAAHVEQRFIAAQPQTLEDLGPHLELPNPSRANEEGRRRDNGRNCSAGNRRGDGLMTHERTVRHASWVGDVGDGATLEIALRVVTI